MDNQSPGITHYVSVSAERGQVKTSCSAHYTAGTDDDEGSIQQGLAHAMQRSMAVATLAHQSVLILLNDAASPDDLQVFIDRVNAVASEIARGD